jgi:hypothetical protein
MFYKKPKGIFFLGVVILLFGCTTTRVTTGEYVHSYVKGGHNKKIIIENDSVLVFESNVSMLFLNISGNYIKTGRTLTFIPRYNEIEKCFDTIPFSSQEIYIKNRKTLEIEGIKFKYKRSRLR